MKRLLFLFVVVNLKADVILNEIINPLKTFSPPPLIKPLDKYYLENQYDLTNRTNYLDDEFNKTYNFTTALFHNSLYNSFLFKNKEAKYYSIFNIRNTKANSYKDASGKKINFGYKRFNIGAILGYTPNEFNDTKLAFFYDDLKNDKQPHYQMDPVKTTRTVYMLSHRYGQSDLSDTFNISFKYIDFLRKANNYELRNSTQKMRMQVDKNTFNTELSYDKDFDNFHTQMGLSYSYDTHTAKRFANNVLNAYKYPDVKTNEYIIFANNYYKIDDFNKINFGVSYTTNTAKTTKQNIKLKNPSGKPPFFPNANNLWKMYYGKTFDGKITQNALSFSIGYEYDDNLNKALIDYKRLVRMPNNLERFTSIFAPISTSINVSNPFIKPEIHNLIKLSISSKNEAYKDYLNSLFENGYLINAEISFDKIKDLIIFDRARANNANTPNKAVISRNVNAYIFSSKLALNYNFLNNFGTKIALAYNYGQNTSDKRALYQIRPFEINANIDYKNYFNSGVYRIGAAYRYAFSQNRGDFDMSNGLGIDKKLGGFGVLDLYSNIKIKDTFSITFGINNVLNKKYQEFISPSHTESFEYGNINAPGRSIYAKFNASF